MTSTETPTVDISATRCSGTLNVTYGIGSDTSKWVRFELDHRNTDGVVKLNGIPYRIFAVTTRENSRRGRWGVEDMHGIRADIDKREISEAARNTIYEWARVEATRIAETLPFSEGWSARQTDSQAESWGHLLEAARGQVAMLDEYRRVAWDADELVPIAAPFRVRFDRPSDPYNTGQPRSGTAHARVYSFGGNEIGLAVDVEPHWAKTRSPLLVPTICITDSDEEV